jgi:hypothetical protein
MLTPSREILPWFDTFARAMTAPTFQNALVLFCGTVLASGPRTVTAALRALGLAEQSFCKYHRFFSRAEWSPLFLSRLLLDLLVRTFLPPHAPLLVVADETLERRRGPKVAYRGLFRDPIRSTASQVQYAWGIRWLVLALVVPVPWSRRPWALPFVVVPLLSEKLCQRLKRKHRTVVEVLGDLMAHLGRWYPQRRWVLVGDGTFAAVPLAHRCQHAPADLCLVSRLRLDAALHDFPAPRRPGQRGPTPKKGLRLPSLAHQLTDPATEWERVQVRWYGGEWRTLEVATGVCLWYRGGHPPVPLRWVLVRSPEGDPHPLTPGAVFATDPALTPVQVLTFFIARWNIEVTFAEVRAHLGFETQRHWSRRAVGRLIPCLFGVFSLVVVMAKLAYPEGLPVPRSRWYVKEEATFADVLAAVRRTLWGALTPAAPPAPLFVASGETPDVYLIPGPLWRQLQQVACYAP